MPKHPSNSQPSKSGASSTWTARLNRDDLAADGPADPLALFDDWFAQAQAADLVDATAAALATANAQGQPSVRTVLVKRFDPNGFYFYTNYASRKGIELDQNPKAALLFWWDTLERQVRIEGAVNRVSPQVSDDYFASRPHGSQIGAHASRQSRTIASRGELEKEVAKYEQAFGGQNVPRPENWGGYVLAPEAIEFWQGRSNRLHDRLRYECRRSDNVWTASRLAP